MLKVDRLAIEDARMLIDGATRKSNDMEIPMCIAVADEAGNLIAFDRMNGGKISSISIAIDKAFTAAAARNPTHVYNQLCQPGQPTFGIHVTNNGHFCIIGGGLPVKLNGVVVGGIGVSSGTALQDVEVAEAALRYFYEATGLEE
ncbi:MAG: heme-binding protein [Beijerinckiaceae bacterium]|nr:heme-binding protein [Beijerinckiaceae bacterium]